MRKAFLALLLICLSTILAAQQTLTNDSVIKMVRAGLSESIILTTVNASPGRFDTSANGLVALKSAGVSEKIIAALLLKSTGKPGGRQTLPAAVAPPPVSNIPEGIDSVGVYYQAKDGSWQEVMTEVVSIKTGGVLKSMASLGNVKGDINGHLKGSSSRLRLSFPANFIFYVPEGRSPGEYQLIRLRSHDNDREFRSQTGGWMHSSTGAERDSAEFEAKKLGPRIYQITLNMELGRGEYGFMPPNDSGTMNNTTSQGKIYTFSMIE